MRLRDILGDYLSLLGSRAAGAALSVLSLWLSVRLLAPEAYGAVALVSVTGAVAAALALGWANLGFLRQATEEHHRTGSIGESFWARMALFAGAAAVLGAAAWAGKPWLLPALDLPPALYGWILPFTLSFALAEAASYWLQAVGRVRVSGRLDAARLALEAGGMAAAWKGWLPATPATVLGIQVATRLTLAAASLLALPRGALGPKPRPSRARVRAIAAYSWSVIPGSAAGTAVPFVTAVCLRRSLSLEAVAVFQVARSVTDILGQVLSTTMLVTVPHCMRLRARGAMAELRDYHDRLAPRGVLLWSAGIALAIPLIPPVLPLLGADYAAAALPCQIMLVGLAFNALNVLYYPLLTAFDRLGTSVLINAVAAAGTLAGLYLAVPRWGLVGAAVVVGLGTALGSATYVFFTRGLVTR